MSKDLRSKKLGELTSLVERVQEIEKELGVESGVTDAQQILRSTLEQTYEGLQILDLNWRYVYLNQAAANHGNAKKSDLLGNCILDCYPGIEDSHVFKVMRQVMTERVPRKIENLFKYPKGESCWFELFVEPHTFGILIRTVDITKRKNLEAQYLQSQKIEAIGQLAGGVAHDFNNKLGIMMMYCELSLKKEGLDTDVKRYLQNIETAIEESASLTQKILAFGRKQVFDLKNLNLNQVLKSQLLGLKPVLRDNIEVFVDFSENLWSTKIDPNQFGQVILNLAINASDAMPDGGNLSFETYNVQLDEEYCSRHPEVIPGDYVMLSVTDTGQGIPKEVQGKIFDPFFTTKERGKGTGLGLASVHGIIKQSQGHIWFYSEVGVGSVFKIYFPKSTDSPSKNEVIEQATDELEQMNGNEVVLVVEDNHLLGEGLCETLNKAGYETYFAKNAIEAHSIFEQKQGEIDVVIADIILPGKNGAVLSNELKEKKEALKTIFISGYTENTIVHKGILDTEFVLIQKPIMSKTLLRTLRHVLDGKVTKGLF